MATTSRYDPLDDLGQSDDLDITVTGEEAPAKSNVASADTSSGARRGGGGFAAFLFVFLLLVSLAGLMSTLVLDAQRRSVQATQVEIASRLLMLSQRISRQAREGSLGDAQSYTGLEDTRAAVDGIIQALDAGDSSIGIAPLAGTPRAHLESLRVTWAPLRSNADAVLTNQDAVLAIRNARDQVNDLAPLLLAQSDEVVETMVLEQADPTLINLAGRQRTLTQRIRASVNEFALGEQGAEVAATQFGRDIRLFGRTIRILEQRVSAPVKAKLDAVKLTYQELSNSVEGILGNVAEFFAAQLAARSIGNDADQLLDTAQTMVRSISEVAPVPSFIEQYVPEGVDVGDFFKWSPWLFGGLSLVFLMALMRMVMGRAQTEARVSTEANLRTQEAVLKLLDEMSDLADGDLTIQTEVTDQVTGAIADSVNFAVEEMRSLVLRIKQAASSVSAETQGSRQTADNLESAAGQQLQAINTATGEIESMAQSMAELSSDATRFTEVARSSRDVAGRGATSVRQTIQGMNDMRQQIQETAKRIKRLGESSQQINDIVSLITDIAEQTNVLSLNASIQAAMAGEAGRGFAVVADEVQRLADRSGQASRQINELVNTIQRDTNDAVSSMEQATREVVEGTNLADAAGRALGEIERESEQLTSLIQETANKTLQHSRAASEISSRMSTIRVATGEAAQGVRNTALSISNLDLVAQELQESVAGFKV